MSRELFREIKAFKDLKERHLREKQSHKDSEYMLREGEASFSQERILL